MSAFLEKNDSVTIVKLNVFMVLLMIVVVEEEVVVEVLMEEMEVEEMEVVVVENTRIIVRKINISSIKYFFCFIFIQL